MYPQAPISPSLQSRYNSINTGELDKFKGDRSTGDSASMSITSYINVLGTPGSQGFTNFEGDDNEHTLVKNHFGVSKSNLRPTSSNITINDRNGLEPNANEKYDRGDFSSTQRNQKPSSINIKIMDKPPASTPLTVFQPLNYSQSVGTVPRGLHHSPQNRSNPNNVQNSSFINTQNAQYSQNAQNMAIPPPPKVPFSDPFSSNKTSDGERSYSLNKKMQDNKERLEQLNISHSKFASIGSPKELKPSSSQNSMFVANLSQNSLDTGRISAPRNIGIREANSNKANSRSNPRLPPKAPVIGSNNSFLFQASQSTQISQSSQELPQTVTKNLDFVNENSTVGVKDMVRPPTAPTFLPSNKVNINHNLNDDLNNKTPSQTFNGAFKNQSSPLDLQTNPSKNHTSTQLQTIRPPTAPNSSKSAALPKVDLLISLMDKTVESKRKEFEKLNKLKSALSELGDFNRRLLEENTRLKSGNTNCDLHERGVLGKEPVNNSVDSANNYHTPFSFVNTPFIIESQDPDSQVNSLKTIINKKNLRITELEKRLSCGEIKKEYSNFEDGICYSLLNKLKIRDELLCKSLEEIEEKELGKILEDVDKCASIISERKNSKLKTVANDVINQIEFNYKALSVTLDHLLEQQTTTLENIKHENKIGTQFEDSQSKNHLYAGGDNIHDSNFVDYSSISGSPKKHLGIQKTQGNKIEYISYQVTENIGGNPHHVDAFPERLNTEDHRKNIEDFENNSTRFKAEFRGEQTVENLQESRTDFADKNRSYKTTKVINHVESHSSQGNLINFDIQNDGVNFSHQTGILTPETQRAELGRESPREILQSDQKVKNYPEIFKDEKQVTSTNAIQSVPQNNIDPEQRSQYYSNYQQFDGNYGGTENFITGRESEQISNAPPPVLAAYHEGGLENNDLFQMSPSMNLGSYNEEYSYYQAPVNYSNI
ncbi:hypothetical protein HWI79_2399 [Cryptosporidium felis]|nr:hypothetical protein HWI79_2399 [Cryptosporidium felis]